MPTVPYVKQTWVDGSSSTPLSAARMGVIETGVNDISYAPAVRVTHNADQSITNATWTALAFNTEDFDQAGNASSTMHDTVTNNSRLTAQYAGIYLATGFVQWAASATGNRYVSIVKGGGPTPGQGDYTQSDAGINATAGNRLNVTGLYSLNVNDFLVLSVFQDSTGALAVLGTTAANRPEFGMVRVA